ncbi:MFS transporter, DHA1 family, bicyclomycin/chloramphenicol resistance protein [Mesorhizobium albiziae]|uniref:Bcr/CflA family efflux transporter n=2 Tax=Neomesorhizobium albiziae TaxID=335020 RepID=A0A1I3XYU5_9HYPH|nr:Bcr/CflA family drug resistance efflux transporter [Mesorhizobium albiziae]SFK24409.1 MFS transporter, DHA1 family, bicyclomycin/chloramphenicol resistance protein [Mesorhizobium albiziae]
MNQQEIAPLMSERRVSLIGALLVAIGPVSMALFTPAMPELVAAFGTTEAAVKMTISLYFAGFALAQLVCGPLSDGFGRRPVTVAFMGIYLAASLMALFAPTIEILIAARFMQGIGAAVGVAMSRAIVRDLFTQDRSARIMNLIGMILAIGPAFAPVIGGVTMEFFGWHAVFILMVVMGVSIVLVAIFGLRETVTRDLSRIRPRALLASYYTLFGSSYFVLCSLIIAGTTGAIYAQATILSFILIDRVGLSPTAFGASMLAQTGMFFTGSVAVRFLMPRLGAFGLVPIGLGFVAIGSVLLATLLRLQEPSLLTVMGPVGAYAFGIAFVMPAMTTAAMAPFPKIAGAAASLTGFVQMGSGLLGGMIAAWLGDAVVAMATVIPTMGFTAVIAWFLWRRLPEPVQPVISPRERIEPPIAQ